MPGWMVPRVLSCEWHTNTGACQSVAHAASRVPRAVRETEWTPDYRYILCETFSQFDSLPLTCCPCLP